LKKHLCLYLLLACLSWSLKYGVAQGTGVLHYTRNELITELGELSGSRLAVVGAALDSNVVYFSVFNDAYQRLWSLRFDGYSSASGLPQYAELNDGNIVLMIEKNVSDDSVEVLKVAPSGQVLMDKQYHFGGREMRYFDIDAAPPGDNGFILAGNTVAQPGSSTYAQVHLVKCNANGDVAWCHEYTQADVVMASVHNVVTDSAGYTVLTGANTGSHPWIFHVDVAGVCDWGKVLQTGAAYDSPRELQRTSSGGYVMSGVGYQPNGTPYGVLTFIAPGFSSAVMRQYPYFQYEFNLADFALAPQGRVRVTGTWGDAGTGQEFGIFELDSVGDLVWGYASRFPDGNEFVAKSVASLANGNLAAICWGYDYHNREIYLMELDAAGQGLCMPNSFPILPEPPTTLSIVDRLWAANPVLVTISAGSYSPQATPSFTFQPVCGTVGVPEAHAQTVGVTLSPNPGQGMFAIKISGDACCARVSVYSSAGTLVHARQLVQGQRCEIDATHLPSGIYMVEVTEGQNRWVGKWMKE
jgi:Secretion system C-terminal sorting domain